MLYRQVQLACWRGISRIALEHLGDSCPHINRVSWSPSCRFLITMKCALNAGTVKRRASPARRLGIERHWWPVATAAAPMHEMYICRKMPECHYDRQSRLTPTPCNPLSGGHDVTSTDICQYWLPFCHIISSACRNDKVLWPPRLVSCRMNKITSEWNDKGETEYQQCRDIFLKPSIVFIIHFLRKIHKT